MWSTVSRCVIGSRATNVEHRDGALVEVERAMVLAVSDLRRDGGLNC